MTPNCTKADRLHRQQAVVARSSFQTGCVTKFASRLEDGLRMAQAMSRVQPIATVSLISDGNVPPDIEFELPYKLNFQKLGFLLKRERGHCGPQMPGQAFAKRSWDVFARIEGTNQPGRLQGGRRPQKHSANTSCCSNGVASDAQSGSVSIDGGKCPAAGLSQVVTTTATTLELQIKPDQFDSLASDNAAYLELPGTWRAVDRVLPVRGMETVSERTRNHAGS